MSALTKLPAIDFAATWAGLSAETRERIGTLVIEEQFLRHAAMDLQGDRPGEGIRYLTRAGQRAAERRADEISVDLRDVVHAPLPDLFGCNPSDEHPNGTDPAWAAPVVFRVKRVRA